MDIKKIGLSTSAFGYTMGSTGKNTDRKNSQPWTIEEFVNFAYGRSLGGIEAPLKRFIPDLNPEHLKKLRSLLIEREMFFLMDVETALDADQIIAMIPLAKEFGSNLIRIKSSNILSGDRQKFGQPWANHIQHCISVLRDLVPRLRDQELKIAIENHQDLDSNDLIRIIEAVGSDVVGVNFDIGNAFSVCEDPINFANKLGSSVINIHLKDYKIFRSDDGFRLARCPLGEGSVDFKTILPLLEKNSPNARMVIELGALEARNIAWLTASFWEEIQPRKQSELVTFFQQIENQTIRTADDTWKTPWEQGGAMADIINYEISELETSLVYLSSI